MINVVLFDEESIIRIAQRAKVYFSNYIDLRVNSDTIWVKGLYIKFYPRQIIVNTFYPTTFTLSDIFNCLTYVLDGEEVFISDDKHKREYIDAVNAQTNFHAFLS